MVHIKSKLIPDFVWNIKNAVPISDDDKAFIETFAPPIYHNDVECYLWAFDTKLPSGKWLENVRFKNDLRSGTAIIF